MSGWEFLQDDDIEPQHLDVLTGAVQSMDECGAGTVTMSALTDDDELLAMYSAVKVDGVVVAFHLDIAAGRPLWAMLRDDET